MNDWIFLEPKFLGRRLKVKLDLSNYATKVDLKNGTGVGTSKFAKKVYLANLKSRVDKWDVHKLINAHANLGSLKVDKLDFDKLVLILVDLSELIDAVKNDVVKKNDMMLKWKMLKMKCLILLS